MELEFIACTAFSHPPAPPFLLLFLLLCSCCPLNKSAIPGNCSGDEERRNRFFFAVFPCIMSDTGFACAEALPGVAAPQGACPLAISGFLQLLLNNEIINMAH